MTAPMALGPGTMGIRLPESLLGSGANAQSLPIETQGLTSQAAEAAVEALKQLQLEDAEKKKKALRAMFGDDFPLTKENPTDSDWERWASNRWDNYRPGVSQNILWAERNRLFRAGQQLISPYGSNGVWRPAPQPKDSVRIVANKIRPALAWALEVLAEQRPGWRFQPTNTDPDRQDKAEAQQRAVEYQYNAQEMHSVMGELEYWAQTDGVAFAMTYWDPEKGDWAELEAGKGPVPLGDMGTKVYRIEQVRVSAEATATVRPMLWIVREIMPRAQGVALYGPDILEQADQQLLAQQMTQLSSVNQFAYTPLYQDQPTIARYTIFCEKSQWLPKGLTVIIVGKKVVFGPKPLLMGRIPMSRWTDGSEDPAFFPTPKMNTLIGPQMRVNQLLSKGYESIRKNSGGRYATKNGAVSAETLIGGEVSILEVRTTGDIRESIQAIPGFSIGTDIKEMLEMEVDTIEQETGYSKESRGQFTSDQSGKAILAIREQLERVFAPFCTAIAKGATEWGKQAVGWMQFGYQTPRKVAVLGKDRTDLAIDLSAETLDGVVDISVDPETLVPQPKALKQWMLDNAFDRKLITKEQWLERSPIGDVRDMQSPSKMQYAKGKRVVEQIRLGQEPDPVVWMDDEGIQQNVLERDLIMAGGTPPDQWDLAMQRWQQLAQQAQKKKGPQPPQPGTPEAMYQEFRSKAIGQIDAAFERVVADALKTIDLANAPTEALMAIAGGGVPSAEPMLPKLVPQQHAPSERQSPRKLGQKQDPRAAPTFAGPSPSVAAAPAAMSAGA